MTGKRILMAYSVKPRLLVLLCVVTALAQALPPLQAGLTIAFLLIMPGAIVLNGVPMRDSVTRLTLSLALSLSLASIAAQVILAINGRFAFGWPLEAGFWALLVLSLLLSILQVIVAE
jgi:hypothetical protein